MDYVDYEPYYERKHCAQHDLKVTPLPILLTQIPIRILEGRRLVSLKPQPIDGGQHKSG